MESKRMSNVKKLDRITTLPPAIVETILCLLPIEEAARTSILSKEWRYKWTKIPKLVFSQFSTVKISPEEKKLSLYDQNQPDFYKVDRRNKDMRCTLFGAIHQVLLQRQSPIHEFTLSMSPLQISFEIDQIMLHLSRNHTVKKLKLDLRMQPCPYCLPLSVLPWPHLTDLNIKSCEVNHKPVFNGFVSLTSLSFKSVTISGGTLIHILYNCPSLKRLCLLIFEEHLPGDENLNIMELFKCLPVIEHLTTWGCFIQSLVQASGLEEPPISLIHLKYCIIKLMCFFDGYGLPFLLVLIKCAPNLKKIKLEIDTYCCTEVKPVTLDVHSVNLEEYSVMLEKCSVMFEEYSHVQLEHLNELEIEDFSNFKPELEFVKFILARSPNLKKVILLTHRVDKNEEADILKVLLSVPRASPKQPKMKAKRLSNVQRLDRITTLPQAIIETILCLLPTEEAAMTSVLSKEWRYKWITIPKLEFVQPEEKQPSASGSTSDLETARKNMDTRCQLFYIIYQVLLLRQGPILDFFL